MEREAPALNKILNDLTYGLFVLSAKIGDKDNGCIINTAMQHTTAPELISVTVSKANYTCQMILQTGAFNLSILNQEADFSVFRQFGFQSGRDVDKFDKDVRRSNYGIAYLQKECCGYLSAEVQQHMDLGTHVLFFAKVTQQEKFNDVAPVTYREYHARIKPQPAVEKETKGFVCQICGYVYEGESLPPDFICPICKHGAQDFTPIQG